jgi:predicted nucleic acid-binding protein
LTLILDASVVVSALIDPGADGIWARSLLEEGPFAAPHLMPAETENILRRRELAGVLAGPVTSRAHAALLEIPVVLYDYADLADRIWELRHNVTVYDAWYIALAEALNAELATLDVRLALAPGVHCSFRLPPN